VRDLLEARSGVCHPTVYETKGMVEDKPPRGSHAPGTFWYYTRDFERFALLYLHGGKWNDAQVVPEDWVRVSTHPYSDAHSGGYGYLWWTADSASGTPQEISFPAGSFWAEGHLGQYAVVVPSRDLIIVNRVDEELTKRQVSKRQMARFAQMVLAVALPN